MSRDLQGWVVLPIHECSGGMLDAKTSQLCFKGWLHSKGLSHLKNHRQLAHNCIIVSVGLEFDYALEKSGRDRTLPCIKLEIVLSFWFIFFCQVSLLYSWLHYKIYVRCSCTVASEWGESSHMKGSVQGNKVCPGSHSTMVLGLEMAMLATGEAGRPAAVYIRDGLQSWDQLLNAVAEIFSRTVWILGVTLVFGGEGVFFFFFLIQKERRKMNKATKNRKKFIWHLFQ